jgi:hypothetical protein
MNCDGDLEFFHVADALWEWQIPLTHGSSRGEGLTATGVSMNMAFTKISIAVAGAPDLFLQCRWQTPASRHISVVHAETSLLVPSCKPRKQNRVSGVIRVSGGQSEQWTKDREGNDKVP